MWGQKIPGKIAPGIMHKHAERQAELFVHNCGSIVGSTVKLTPGKS